MKKVILIFSVFFLSLSLYAQDKEEIVQFSGLVLTHVKNYPIPYASISVKNSYRGTIANTEGFFSIAIKATDTIVFSAVGFKQRLLVLPENIEEKRFSTLVMLKQDTLTFDETVIYPWPSPGKFKEAFLALNVDKDLYDLARENLSVQTMMRIRVNMKMDGPENQRYQLQQMAVRAGYLGGQTNYAIFPGSSTPVPLSLMNPFAWAEFIKALKEGRFKDQYKEYREY